ncbi:MAG: threonine synthase [Bacteroidota bacterium]
MGHTFFSHLRCSQCDRTYDPVKVQTVCGQCNKTLLAVYDLASAKRSLSIRQFSTREKGLWRYRELLPVVDDASIVSLGEGWTPLLQAKTLGKELGLRHLFIKDESLNPTGSFKARGLCVAVSRLKELGIAEVAMPSAGNAGGALAAYAAKAGIQAHVFVPNDTPVINVRETRLYGAEVFMVDGVISDAGKIMNEMRQGKNWFDMSTMKEPYRLEGKKTLGYELAEQFDWKLPDVIVYPTGGGTGLIGMWKAFREMEELGWITGRKPRMVVVQSAGCAPIVKAFEDGRKDSEFWNNSATLASGLRVPKAFADELILSAVYESGGTAVSVNDDELLADMKLVARQEGLLLCPEGAATVSAVRHLLKKGFIQENETVVAFNTGSGYKYVEVLERLEK